MGLSPGLGGTGGFPRSVGEKPGTLEGESAKCAGWALRLGAGARNQRKVAVKFEAGNFRNLERTQFQFFGDGPAGDESDSEADFDRGLDGFGGIEIHDVLERLELEASVLQSDLDDATGAGTLFPHQKIRSEERRVG